jgi:uncharacterized membrane protein
MIRKDWIEKLRDRSRSKYLNLQHGSCTTSMFNNFVYWNYFFILSNDDKNKSAYKSDWIK